VTCYTEGFSHFVTSMTAPVASGWSVRRVGLAPTGKRRLGTAHTLSGHCGSRRRTSQLGAERTLADAPQANFRPANVMQMKFPSLTSPQPCGAPAAIGGDENCGDPAAVEMQRATEGPGVLPKGAAIVGNLWSRLFTGRIGCWRRARDLRKTFRLLGGHDADNLSSAAPRLRRRPRPTRGGRRS
jgi:hypothetical protein